MKLFLFTDGGSRSNPGPAATGAVLQDENGKVLAEATSFLGVATNNVAEYQALLEGLALALKYKPKELICLMDSKLVVEQSLGHWKVKEPGLKPLVCEVQKILLAHPEVSLQHIRREKNKLADALVNKTLDAHVGRF